MSIFIACTIPQESRERIRDAMRSYQDVLVRSVPQEKWHCTMLFMGDITIPQEALISFMKPIRQTFHPVVRVLSLGQGKAEGQLWAYIQPNQLLQDIRSTLIERATQAKLSIPDSDREYVPHINVGTLQERSTTIAIPDAPANTSFSLRELTIFQSIPETPEAPYAPLGIIPITP